MVQFNHGSKWGNGSIADRSDILRAASTNSAFHHISNSVPQHLSASHSATTGASRIE